MDQAIEATRREGALADGETLEDLFRTHFNDVYRSAARLLGPGADRADVEDTTQEVFIVAQRSFARFRGDSKISTWLYGITARVVMNRLRGWRRHRRLIHALEADPMPRASLSSPEQQAATRQELFRVWRQLMRIKPKKRIVYVMHEVEGLSGPEIAEILGIPEATVWTRLRRARAELVAALDRAALREVSP